MGRDYFDLLDEGCTPQISIHAPRVGRDLRYYGFTINRSRFQSTRPVWGATWISVKDRLPEPISIHAPRVGRDIWNLCGLAWTEEFQSTRPVWGATAD